LFYLRVAPGQGGGGAEKEPEEHRVELKEETHGAPEQGNVIIANLRGTRLREIMNTTYQRKRQCPRKALPQGRSGQREMEGSRPAHIIVIKWLVPSSGDRPYQRTAGPIRLRERPSALSDVFPVHRTMVSMIPSGRPRPRSVVSCRGARIWGLLAKARAKETFCCSPAR